MKRGWKMLAVLVALVAALTVGAQAAGKSVDIYINGDRLDIPPSFGAPFYDESSRLQIPMRYIIESCGYEVDWNGEKQCVTVPGKRGDVVITLGSSIMVTPGGNVTMDTSAMARDGRTYIPLRYALEALGFKVNWTGGQEADRVDITGALGGEPGRVPLTAKEVAAIASPAVFYIEVMDEDVTTYASGSGFFIDPSGVGVTNYHVIEGASYAGIVTVDGEMYMMDKVLYYNVERDLAIFNTVKILEDDTTTRAVSVPYLKMADPESIANGDAAFAIGSPLGLQNSITDGLVSNRDRVLEAGGVHYIQTSAPISHGNSGGALLNQYGEVIGVNTAMLTEGQNLNFAIPIGDVAAVRVDGVKGMELWEVTAAETAIIPPVNVRVVRQEGDTAFIQWDPVEGADCYHFYYQGAGEDGYWYDEEKDGDGPMDFDWTPDYSVEYYGLSVGSVYNVFITSEKNGQESRDSQVLTFLFTGGKTSSVTTPSRGVVYYSGAWWAPDFGAVAGIKPFHTDYNDGFYQYSYDCDDFDLADVVKYGDVLRAEGYFWNGDEEGDGMFYYNAEFHRGILLSYSSDGTYYTITTREPN